MTNEKIEKVLDKVKKLLAVADSTNNSNANECESALLKAQSLLASAGLSMEDVAQDESLKEIVEMSITELGQTIWWKRDLSVLIAKNFRCISYTTRHHRKTGLGFCGIKADAEIAKTVFQFASRYCAYASDLFMLKNPVKENRAGVKNDYIKGFIAGLDAKYKEQVKNNDWGLVLVKDKSVQDYVDDKMKKGKAQERNIADAKDYSAIKAGFTAGKGFEVPKAEIAQ